VISLRSPLAVLFVASLLGFAACKSTPQGPPGVNVRTSGDQDVTLKAPIDVAILPIANLTGGAAPTDDLRTAFQRVLVARKYSPLAFEYVDRNITEASYTPGASQEHAVMSIELTSWNTSLWETHNSVEAGLRVRLLDAGTGGTDLWKAETNRRFEFGTAFDRLPTDAARMKLVCDTIATEILERLPARRGNTIGG